MRKLSTQILASQTAILAITVVVGFALLVRGERTHLDHVYEQRAAAIAATTPRAPAGVESCFSRPTSAASK